jgi:hypothetical protein
MSDESTRPEDIDGDPFENERVEGVLPEDGDQEDLSQDPAVVYGESDDGTEEEDEPGE